jgi:tripeptidyl-peptidase-1
MEIVRFLLVLILAVSLCQVHAGASKRNAELNVNAHLFDLQTVKREDLLAARFHLQDGIRKYEAIPLNKDHMHEVIFAVKQRNVDKLHNILVSVSDPTSPDYGKHWTREEVAHFTENKVAVTKIHEALKHHDIEVTSTSTYSEFITASASIEKWEAFFHSKFFHFHDEINDKLVVRALQHSLPSPLSPYVSGVFGVSDYFLDRSQKSKKVARSVLKNMLEDHQINLKELSTQVNAEAPPFPPFGNNSHPWCILAPIVPGGVEFCLVYPQFLYSFYNSSYPYGSAPASQAVFGSLDQSFSPDDLQQFQEIFNLTVLPAAGAYNGHVYNNACYVDTGNCDEASLDMQYITTMAQGVPTYFDYYDNSGDLFLGWIMTVANMVNPADVFSISYGGYEAYTDMNAMTSFNIEAMKLGIQGVSIINSAGDNGAVGDFPLEGGPEYCGYYSASPSVSPYITSVGATQGPEAGKPEITCQVPNSVITSGGGFSSAQQTSSQYPYNSYLVNPVQYWQTSAVNAYLASQAGVLATGYGSGRGYPDVSMLGNNYFIVINGTYEPVSGTSASTPAFAGVVSQANSIRKQLGMSTLGFLNPLLYQYAPMFVNDITVGDNKCTSGANSTIVGNQIMFEGVCCEQGFNAIEGWDPVTGLGSINVDKFLNVAVTFTASGIPTLSPTSAPPSKAIVSLVQSTTVPVESISTFTINGDGNVAMLSNSSHFAWLSNSSSAAAFATAPWHTHKTCSEPGMFMSVYSMTMDDTGTNLLVGGSSPAYSLDGGMTWNMSMINPGSNLPFMEFAASSSDNGVIIAGSSNAMFISHDFGMSFPIVLTSQSAEANYFAGVGCSASGQTLVIGLSHGVNTSTDGGMTWHSGMGFSESANAFTSVVASDSMILAMERSALYASYDGGYNFSTLPFPSTFTFYGIAASADLSRIVVLLNGYSSFQFLVSANMGSSFFPLEVGPYATELNAFIYSIRSFMVDAYNATTMVMTTYENAMYRSSIVWNYVETPQPTSAPTTMSPSFDPTMSPTVEMSVAPTKTPTWAPTTSPTYANTNTPTMIPTVSPTMTPTYTMTNVPTMDPTYMTTSGPTIAPTTTPSAAPTIAVTASPTVAPTVAPSLYPSLQPSVQALPVLSFTSSLSLDNVYATLTSANVYTLTTGQLTSISDAAAASMSQAENAVTVTSYTVVPNAVPAVGTQNIRSGAKKLADTQVLSSVQAQLTTSVLVLPEQSANTLYVALSASLTVAVQGVNNAYDTYLQAYAQEQGAAASFAMTTATAVTNGPEVLVLAPTAMPTKAPSGSSTAAHSTAIIAGSVVGGVIGLVVLLAIIYYFVFVMQGKNKSMASRGDDTFSVKNPAAGNEGL